MAEVIQIKKRKRNPNWEDVEKCLLRECLKDQLGVIENKCTDTNTNKSKEKAWQHVSQCFNELNSKTRTLVELKQQWRTMKLDAKKCNSTFKRALKATGGGAKPPSPDPNTQKIIEMLPLEFEEGVNQFDSDNTERGNQNEVDVSEIESSEIIIKDLISQGNQNEVSVGEMESSKIIIEDHIISQECQTPRNKEIPYYNKRKIIEPSTINKSGKRKRKINEDMPLSESKKGRDAVIISFLQEEHDLKMKHMNETHSWAQEEHEQKMKNLKLKNMILEKQLLQFNK